MASLATVMVLFFVMAMVAAYTSRSLLFEQRTSVNQLRSTQALEAAQSGLDWALGLLNAGRVTATCTTSTDAADNSFKDRYLSIDTSTANVTPKTKSGGGGLYPTCVASASGWDCSCPVDGDPSLSVPSENEVRPAFRVRFVDSTERPRSVKVEVMGCTKLVESCLSFADADRSGATEGRALVSAVVSMKSALPTIPMAAVTARGAISNDLVVYNTDSTTAGVTLHTGATSSVPDSKLHSLPGTPGAASKVESEPQFGDGALAGGSSTPVGERMFAAQFGLWPTSYSLQPATFRVTCAASCTDADVRTAVANNPGRMIWVPGSLSIDTATAIGSATEPVLLVIQGSLTFTAPATIHGVVYLGRDSGVAPAAASISGTGTIQGALFAEHQLSGTGDPTIAFNSSVLSIIRARQGSFVVVPGTWKDF